jgi:iron complex transport system ATP-binding protein
MLSASGLAVRYPGAARAALEGVTLEVRPGELVAIAGPNGSGKTTLLRALLGLVAADAGSAAVDGRPVATWPRSELARAVGVVTQREETVFPLRVHEAVMLGRYARLGPLAAVGDADRAAVADALARCDVTDLAERRVDELSGGEWQRVRVARALAQVPRALVLDEPTASLDIRHEMELFELIRGLATGGLAALVVTHQLNLASRFADRMLLLSEGRPVALGTPAEVLTHDALTRVFRWPVAVTAWADGSPQVVPLRPGETRSAALTDSGARS